MKLLPLRAPQSSPVLKNNRLRTTVFSITSAAALLSTAGASAQVADLTSSLHPASLNAFMARDLAPADFSSSAPMAEAPLPEAPVPQLAMTPKPKRGSDPSDKIANKRALTIPSDWHAQRLNAGQKMILGAEDLYSVNTVAGFFIAAGWEQLTNGAPNYGTDKGAFGARLGAAALRGSSQTVFSEIVLAPILHQDPRYYVKGPGHSFLNRVIYAGTRPLITRKDDGASTINASLLLGYAGSAALTPTYYPQINRNFHDVASVYGGSIGGAALGYLVSEFSQDALRYLHLSRQP